VGFTGQAARRRQTSSTIRRCASACASMYRWVVESDACPASSCTSLSDPPTAPIFRAALVMNSRRPLWLEQPLKPRARYQTANRFTIADDFKTSRRRESVQRRQAERRRVPRMRWDEPSSAIGHLAHARSLQKSRVMKVGEGATQTADGVVTSTGHQTALARALLTSPNKRRFPAMVAVG
jgi:hypothetical protein